MVSTDIGTEYQRVILFLISSFQHAPKNPGAEHHPFSFSVQPLILEDLNHPDEERWTLLI